MKGEHTNDLTPNTPREGERKMIKLILYKKVFGWYFTLERKGYKHRQEYCLRVWRPYARPKRGRRLTTKNKTS